MQTGSSPLSQVQPYSGHAGVRKHKHIRDVPITTISLWYLRAPCAQTHPFRPKSRLRGKEAIGFSACDPGEAASGCSKQPPGLQASHPFTLLATPRSPPGGAGLRRERVWSLHNDPRSWRRRAGGGMRGGGGPSPRSPQALWLGPPGVPGARRRWGAQQGSPGSGRPRRVCFGDPGRAGHCALSGPTRGSSRSRALRGGCAEPRASDRGHLLATRAFAGDVLEDPRSVGPEGGQGGNLEARRPREPLISLAFLPFVESKPSFHGPPAESAA